MFITSILSRYPSHIHFLYQNEALHFLGRRSRYSSVHNLLDINIYFVVFFLFAKLEIKTINM